MIHSPRPPRIARGRHASPPPFRSARKAILDRPRTHLLGLACLPRSGPADRPDSAHCSRTRCLEKSPARLISSPCSSPRSDIKQKPHWPDNANGKAVIGSEPESRYFLRPTGHSRAYSEVPGSPWLLVRGNAPHWKHALPWRDRQATPNSAESCCRAMRRA